MNATDEQGRPEPQLAASEHDMLVAFLDYQRATLEWKTAGLDAEGLRAGLAPTTMTLGGILKHMAWVEDYWFGVRLLARAPDESWANVDWDADGDWEWNSAANDAPDDLRALWTDATERSRATVAEIMTKDGLDCVVAKPSRDGRAPTLRWILVHMIEEYARHNGHADLLRESVDGQTGE